jgi:hypothetical protein
MPNRLPHSTPLTGADYFNLLVQRNLQKLGYRGNVIHMAIDLSGNVSRAEMEHRLRQKEIFGWLNSIQLKHNYPIQMPCWEKGEEIRYIEVDEMVEGTDILPAAILNIDLKPEPGKLFHIGLIQLSTGLTRVVFSAHHSIIDNRGVQMLMRMLDDLDTSNYQGSLNDFFPEARVKDHFLKKLKKFNDSRHFLMNADNQVATLIDGKIRPNLSTNYHIINFSKSETISIDENSIQHGARFGNGSFYLAATARSVNAILIDRGTHGSTIWVPVPQDQRRRGGVGAVLSNQVSFMFYRIPFRSLDSLKSTVESITLQMVDQVRRNMPDSYLTMMNIFRRMPLRIYNLFMKWPTKGVVTTFSFSDIGASAQDFSTFFGHRIKDVFHYPPNPIPPGFTVVFMRFNGCLRVIVGSTEQSMSQDELAKFENLLRLDLVAGDQ